MPRHRFQLSLRLSGAVLALLLAGWPHGAGAPKPAIDPPAVVVARAQSALSSPAPAHPVAPPVVPSMLNLAPAALDETMSRWGVLLVQADAGDPQAACRLAELLDDCRLMREVLDMVDTQISVAAANSTALAADAEAIARLEASVDVLDERCTAVPGELRARSWDYLLRAAVAGHEPSMLRFIADPPLDAQHTAEQALAVAEYRRHAALLLTLLVQRESPAALALAFRAAQGEAFGRVVPVQARDAAAVVRLGTALIVLREADENSEEVVARAASELHANRAERARQEGYALALRFLSSADETRVAATATSEDCARGWPGMRPEYTAYSY